MHGVSSISPNISSAPRLNLCLASSELPEKKLSYAREALEVIAKALFAIGRRAPSISLIFLQRNNGFNFPFFHDDLRLVRESQDILKMPNKISAVNPSGMTNTQF